MSLTLMVRFVCIYAAFLVATYGLAMGQLSLPTLDWQQFDGSTMVWLSPRHGQSVHESDLFSQPGIGDYLGDYDEMVLHEVRQGEGGIIHRHYQQRHAGYEVEGAMFATHEKDGLLRVANGQLAYLQGLEEPGIPDWHAVWIVQSLMGMLAPIATEGVDYLAPSVRLLYAPTTWETYGAPLEYRLAYQISIVVTNPYASTISYVDAHTGQIFRTEEASMNCSGGSAFTLYHGWQPITTKFYNFLGSHYELRDECRGERIHTRVDEHNNNDTTHFYAHGACSDLNDGDNLWQAADQRPAASLHWAAEMFYDYMLARFGRDGVDGVGGKINVVYHPHEMRERTGTYTIFGWEGHVVTPLMALWDRHLKEAHFGRGDEVDPWVSLDVVSHELTHGIISSIDEELLTGGNESRTLNESFADIFSVCTEAYILPLHDPSRLPNLTFGEDVATGPRRSMSEPWLFNCPRAYQAAAWQPGNSSEPHQFSSVQTYWFYLLAFGSAGKPIEANATVCGIGLDNAAEIAYRMITDYMHIGVTHQDARLAAIQAAQDAFGVGSFETVQCENAWAAVGIGNGGSFCNPVGMDGSTTERILTLVTAPNPAGSMVTITLTSPVKESNCTLGLWSSLGKKVANVSIPCTIPPGEFVAHLDCVNLTAGAYQLVYSSDHAHICRNILIID